MLQLIMFIIMSTYFAAFIVKQATVLTHFSLLWAVNYTKRFL